MDIIRTVAITAAIAAGAFLGTHLAKGEHASLLPEGAPPTIALVGFDALQNHVYQCKKPDGCWAVRWPSNGKGPRMFQARKGDLALDGQGETLLWNSGWWCISCSPTPGTHRPK